MIHRTLVGTLAALLTLMSTQVGSAQVAKSTRPVRVTVGPSGLVRDGKPYRVKGGGGSGSMSLLASLGGNSVRTWGADGLDKTLDEAQKHGLTVAVGIWLGQPRQGFDYRDAASVARQLEMAKRVVRRYKDHPAVLVWGLGNEMEGDGDDPAIWAAIERIAAEAKAIDPDHPTMTVVAEIGGAKVKNLHRLCPSIDIVGINSYAGAASVPRRYREAGGTRPYILTEFGPPGTWESARNGWGVVPELTSGEKADWYRKEYEAVEADRVRSLGSYAFLWGHKQEATATWFGMLLPDGRRLASADLMGTLWSGKAPSPPCPALGRITLDGPAEAAPGSTLTARVAVDAGGRPVETTWTLTAEVVHASTGGDREEPGRDASAAIVRSGRDSATIKVPAEGGGYRLSAIARDGSGGAATSSLPISSKGSKVPGPGRKATIPLVVYDDGGKPGRPFAPSGWMGNTGALALDESCPDRPHAGATCLRLTYKAGDAWAGIAWQDPPGDWGDRPGGYDLAAATKLTLWARGAKGGEVVSFEAGLIGPDKPYPDSAKVRRGDVRLATDWRKVTLDLAGKDLTRIKSGLVVTVAGQGGPITIDLDDIRYE